MCRELCKVLLAQSKIWAFSISERYNTRQVAALLCSGGILEGKMSDKKLRVNIVSESEISVQGHGVHTAYIEMAEALRARGDIELINGEFGRSVDCDVVHIHTVGPRVWRKLLQKGPKKVVSAHVVPASFIGSIILARYWRFAARWYLGWFYRRADRVLAVSGMVAEALEHELGVERSKITTMYNSIDMKKFTPSPASRSAARKQLGVGENDFVVLGNGQVQPRKRLDTFTAMAKAHPEVKFIWVGGIPFKQLGADYRAMQQLMNTAPANLSFTGVIPREDVKAYFQAADVFCLPAEQENHPMCVLEAAGAELPIILRDIPEYNDTFGSDALLCKTDQEFIEAVEQLKQSEARTSWRKATLRIRDRFDSTTMTDQLVGIYRAIIGN